MHNPIFGQQTVFFKGERKIPPLFMIQYENFHFFEEKINELASFFSKRNVIQTFLTLKNDANLRIMKVMHQPTKIP
jgi:hypothetical protein